VIRLSAHYGKFSKVYVVNNGDPVFPEGAVCISSSEDLGLFSRFAVASLCRTPAVLIADDDLEIPESSVQFLYGMWKSNSGKPHSIEGRRIVGGKYGEDCFGKCQVVLTRGMITSPSICAKALQHFNAFQEFVGGVPVGNGEDILLSGITKGGFAYPVPYLPLPAPYAIHKHPEHWKYRQKAVEWCQTNL
jgi:hypothetical protein